MSSDETLAGTALESRKPTILAIVVSIPMIAFSVVLLRVYTRTILLRNFGVDDGCVIIALLFTLACATLVGYNTRNGFGAHQSTVSDDEFRAFMKTFYFSIVTYNIALAAIKTTFLVQYYRAIGVRRYKKAYMIALVIVGAWSVSQILLNALVCIPISAFWDHSAGGSCVPSNPSWYINAAGNIVTDILIMLLPLPILRELRLGRRQKWILISIFCLGFFTCIISIIRIKFLSITEDITWNNVEAAAWSVTELCSGTICASLPTLRPLVSRHFPSFSSHSRSYAIHEDSRAQMNSHQIHQSRGLEMDGFSGQSIHSSESKEQLHVLESRIVIHTDIGQHVQASAPGNHQTLHHTSIEGGSGPEIVVLGK
ncbi:hypothetical protein HG530_014805 [Fusarium avenaceum]|nr:hypothetical protein DER45DRAFT_595987 [Fusarium avenaceum]KAI6750524.1 hypothetical protein HG530_014805 [Fusarium avenaceum]KIL92387.1 hypothetical protein FAVG1_04798 [Fusarium avenaceum]